MVRHGPLRNAELSPSSCHASLPYSPQQGLSVKTPGCCEEEETAYTELLLYASPLQFLLC